MFYHSPTHIIECVSEYIFLIYKKKTHTHTHTHTRRQKAKETKGEKRISVENLTKLFVNLLCVLLTYLIKLWISTGCSYEFNVVYVQQEKRHQHNIRVRSKAATSVLQQFSYIHRKIQVIKKRCIINSLKLVFAIFYQIFIFS